MSAPKHTPGPWMVPHFACDDHPCDCVYVLGEHGGMGSLAEVTVDNGLPISEGGNDGPDLEQAKANAHLIAAAPEMLEALRAAVDANLLPTEPPASGDASSYIQQVRAAVMIRAAIAKATGGDL